MSSSFHVAGLNGFNPRMSSKVHTLGIAGRSLLPDAMVLEPKRLRTEMEDINHISHNIPAIARPQIRIFPPIDLDTKNIQSFAWRMYRNISSNECGHQKYSNFCWVESSEHLRFSIWIPKIFKVLIGGFIKTFPPINLGTKNVQILDWRNHQNIYSDRFGYQPYSKF